MEDILSMDHYQAVLRFIELAIQKKGWKPTRLAKEMGMSDGWISKVLSGDIALKVDMLLKIADTLTVSPASLMPVLPIREGDGNQEMTFEEYCDKIVQQKVEAEVHKAIERVFSKIQQ